MMRKVSRNYSLSVIAPFIAILTLLIAAAVLAQTPGAGQRSAQQAVVPAQQDTGAPALQHQLSPGATNAERAPVSHLQGKGYGALPLDEAPPLFLPVMTYSSGGLGPCSIAVADVNGDLKPDLVVANLDSGDVGVLLGNGDGTFQPAVTYDAGGAASSVAVADVNGDGHPDIVVANLNGTVGVLLGNGDGTFQTAVTYGAGGGGTRAVAVGDLRGNGILDVVVANSCIDQNCDGSVGVLLGNGDGTFQPALTYPTGYAAMAVAVGDMNGDGKPDILVGSGYSVCGPKECHAAGQVGVLLGNGDGTFQAATEYPSGEEYPDSLVVADFRGDGKLDVAAASMFSSNADVLLGNGDGTLQPVVTYGSGGGSDGWRGGLAVADVNRDGKPDLVVVDSGSGEIGVLLGNGDGTFQTAQTYGSGCEPWSVAVADVNNDRGPDLLVANSCAYAGSGTPSVGVLLHAGTTPTTTALVSSLNPAPPLKVVTYNATVASQGGGAVTGSIMFQDGGSTFATVPIASNQAAYSITYKKGGVHTITAVYSGDLQHAASISPPLTEYVEIHGSKTALATSGSPSLVGQPVTFTATTTSSAGTIPDGELVTFYDGTTAIGTGTTAGGVATFTTSSLTVKTHTIKATYAGDDTFEPSAGSVEQVVDKYPTTTALSSSLNPSIYGQAVTLKATVAPTGPYRPTGTVTFKSGSAVLGTRTLNTSRVATLTTAKIPVGADTLTATYSGNTWDANSVSAAITQTVSQASISMVLTSYPNPSAFGISVKFTAKLTSNGGLPSGQPVTFSSNGATLGTANVSSTGVATFSTTTLPQGSDVVTAAYAGTVDYSSASATVTQVVN